MAFSATQIPYKETGYFSRIVHDYVTAEEKLQPFISFNANLNGIKQAIETRKKFNTNRPLLVKTLLQQYEQLTVSDAVKNNIDALLDENTFTICTAHQPNIFTGHLYFVYKILHAIKLADHLSGIFPDNKFVPVYYMGSEDADLDELGHVYINGQKHEWLTGQTGAVGRMKVDDHLIQLINRFGGELKIHLFGDELISLLKACYTKGETLESATFKLVNELFCAYGLVVLLPDNAQLKAALIPVVEKELKTQFSHLAVTETVKNFPSEYKLQASGRDLNLFYLLDDKRERIVFDNSTFMIQSLNLQFSLDEILAELHAHPERFSPNVILRPVFQELILPNIAFIGGGGEIAYWLELKKVFEQVNVPYPVLVLRNSFMIVEEEVANLSGRIGFGSKDLFRSTSDLLNEVVKKHSTLQLSLTDEQSDLTTFYEKLKSTVSVLDITLAQHVEALSAAAQKKITALEKKMLKAEKKKFDAQHRQLLKIKAQLFPHNNLQERVENVLPFYARYGKDFIEMIYQHSLTLEQQFVILESAQ